MNLKQKIEQLILKTSKIKQKIITKKNEKKQRYEAFKNNTKIFNKTLNSISNSISEHIRNYSMFYVLGVILLVFTSWTNGLIIQPNTIVDIVEANSYILIISLGMLLVIVAGYIDLSVGALLGFSGALSVMVYNGMAHNNIYLTIFIMLIFGSFAGFLQGVLIGYAKLPSFIVTLGGMLIFKGLLQYVTKGTSIWPKGSDSSSYITSISGVMPDIISGGVHIFTLLIFIFAVIFIVTIAILGRISKKKHGIKQKPIIAFILKIIFFSGIVLAFGFSVSFSIYGLKYYILAILILFCIFSIITNTTTFGRKIYAVGGNKKSAELSGINSSKITTYVFMINGMITSFAGIAFVAIMGAATASAGNGFELDVISAVFVGGASMAGGIGTITGSMIGAFILGIINKGMDIQSLGIDYQQIIKGLVLLAAVGYDVYSNKKIR